MTSGVRVCADAKDARSGRSTVSVRRDVVIDMVGLVVGRTRRALDGAEPGGIVNHMVLNPATRLDLVFHALAHPARREMLRQLSVGERNLSELASPLRM